MSIEDLERAISERNPPTPAASHRRTDRVLVVDDEFLIRWSLRNRLQTEGFHVAEAASLADARRAFADDPCVIVLDVRLPDGNGLDLLDEILKSRPDVRVIVISAHATADMVERAQQAGAFDFVHKPFDLNAIAAVVDRARQL